MLGGGLLVDVVRHLGGGPRGLGGSRHGRLEAEGLGHGDSEHDCKVLKAPVAAASKAPRAPTEMAHHVYKKATAKHVDRRPKKTQGQRQKKNVEYEKLPAPPPAFKVVSSP